MQGLFVAYSYAAILLAELSDLGSLEGPGLAGKINHICLSSSYFIPGVVSLESKHSSPCFKLTVNYHNHYLRSPISNPASNLPLDKKNYNVGVYRGVKTRQVFLCVVGYCSFPVLFCYFCFLVLR